MAEIEFLAEKGPLTGALNKGALMRELEEGCRQFTALSRPLSFILFDLDDHRFDFAGGRLQVTASLGVAALRPGETGAGELFQKADRASFLAKRSGKKRVFVA